MQENVLALGHVRGDDGLCYILCMVEQGVPFVEDGDQVILDRVQAPVMAMLHKACFAEVLAVLKAIEETLLILVVRQYLMIRAEVHDIACLVLHYHRRGHLQIGSQIHHSRNGHRYPGKVVVFHYGEVRHFRTVVLDCVLIRGQSMLQLRLPPCIVKGRHQHFLLLLLHERLLSLILLHNHLLLHQWLVFDQQILIGSVGHVSGVLLRHGIFLARRFLANLQLQLAMLVSVHFQLVEVDDHLRTISGPGLLFEIFRRRVICSFKFQLMLLPEIFQGRYLYSLRQFFGVNLYALELQLLRKLLILFTRLLECSIFEMVAGMLRLKLQMGLPVPIST